MLDEFEAKNWLSDRRFAESYVADHRAREGSVKLAYALRQRGIADRLIAEVLTTLNASHSDDSEVARARTVWCKKFAAPPSSQQERAKQILTENESITLNLCDEAYWMIRRALENAEKLHISIENSHDFENWFVINAT